MGRYFVVAFIILAGLSVDPIAVGAGANDKALSQASTYQPEAHWSVVRRSFEPWANNIVRGQDRYTGGSGPAWVVELSAPGDAHWNNYTAMVVIDAVTGAVSDASVLASN